MTIEILPLSQKDQPWVARLLTENWGSVLVISRGQTHDASILPGFVALMDGKKVGVLTYRIQGAECELVTLDSWQENSGVGTNLVEAVKRTAFEAGCDRLWLITTNDNLHALGFYQKRGFHLVALRPDAMAAARKIKPSIPEIGRHGIPLRDEIELEIRFN